MKLRNTGSGLESLIIASQTIVRLTKVPTASKRILTQSGFQIIQCKSPVDFMGCFTADARMIVFDAKSSDNPTRLETRESHFAEHQRCELMRYGEAGAVAGLLCEQTTTRKLYWCDWRNLCQRTPSVAWTNMVAIGDSTHAVRWDRVREIYAARETLGVGIEIWRNA